jgi:hypothetical protein
MRNRNEVGAIETVFDGYRFRSRLEARWAVFFKKARIRYIYEPECFRMFTDGELYLPDFYLPDVNMRTTEDKGGIYVEVKPPPLNFNTKEGMRLVAHLAELSYITGKSVLLIEGMPALWDDIFVDKGYGEIYFDAEGDGHYEITITPDFDERWDTNMLFARCYKCFRVRVQHGWHQGPCEYCLKQSDEKSRCDAAHPSLVHAVNVARSYRFEERGRGVWVTAADSTVNGKQTSGRRRCITIE